MDSTCIAYWLRPEIAITVDYGQRAAEAEIAASRAVTGALGLRHEIIRADCGALGVGDMAGAASLPFSPVPEWWPYRNQLLVTLAAMFGVRLGVREIAIGCLATDGVHADGRPEFIAAMSAVLELQEGGIRLAAPAAALTAVELVRRSGVPRGILAWSHSCHTGNYACGRCRGCVKHYEVMGAVYSTAY
jgi:7-cyano-7-deazaguanine synthase